MNGGREVVHVDIAPEVFRILKDRAAAEDRTLKSVVARAVRSYAEEADSDNE